jgi:hypothetical protein
VRGYFRFQFSLRDVEELMLERGVTVTYETLRRWCEKFGARRMSRSHGEAWRLWRPVDQHGAELDMCQAANWPSSKFHDGDEARRDIETGHVECVSTEHRIALLSSPTPAPRPNCLILILTRSLQNIWFNVALIDVRSTPHGSAISP